ncbi:hypothetical protein [Nakamurella panacisegetis]|uniref:hypothetical protein n=1 Tax=Nakamurella panacisegetis TaxID=1090615 RepID=UPI0012FE2E4F|nr:hypothetical protein [Nakamurella panacisegetis]
MVKVRASSWRWPLSRRGPTDDPQHRHAGRGGVPGADSDSGPAPTPAWPPARERRRWLASARLVIVLVVVAAVVGAGSAMAVARVTGWGKQTTVDRFVSNTSSITGNRPTSRVCS